MVVNGVDECECRGKITEMDPRHRLVHTWIGNWHDDNQRTTFVRWELSGQGTRVKVTIAAWLKLPPARSTAAAGPECWRT
jgi:uncharacterized protein YndB with AHSA1/START domain